MWAGSSDSAEVELLAVQLGGGLFQRHGQRAGGDHLANLAAVDHRLQVVELVDLQAAENDHLGVQAFLQVAVELLGLVVAQRHLFHGGGHDHARGVEAAGGKRLVDVDLGHLLGELVGQLGELFGQLVDVGRLGLPQDALDVVLPRVLQHDDAARRLCGDRLRRVVLDGRGGRIEPVLDEGHRGSRGFRPAGRPPWPAIFPARGRRGRR